MESTSMIWLGVIGSALLLFFFLIGFVVKQYKRCPSNKVLVIFGKVGKDRAAQCIHGGGKFIIPLLQDYAFLPLEPMVIDSTLNAPSESPTRSGSTSSPSTCSPRCWSTRQQPTAGDLSPLAERCTPR